MPSLLATTAGRRLLRGVSATGGYRRSSSFSAEHIVLAARTELRPKPDLGPHAAPLPFGRHFTDHQLEVRWDHEAGWGAPEIVPQRDIPTHPASLGLNHGVACFEGMKAFANAIASGALGALKVLNLESNKIGIAGISAFSDAIAGGALGELERTNLWGNPGSHAPVNVKEAHEKNMKD